MPVASASMTRSPLGSEVLREPRLGLGAEGDAPGVGVDEDVRLLVMLDLEQEVLGPVYAASSDLQAA